MNYYSIYCCTLLWVITLLPISLYATHTKKDCQNHDRGNQEHHDHDHHHGDNNKPPQNDGNQGHSGGGGNVIKFGFFPYPMLGLDFDRNRYVVYVGSKNPTREEFDAVSNSYKGPYLLVENGFFSGNIGVIISPFTMVGGGFAGLGLGVNGRTAYESWRLASTYEEAHEMPRLKHFPRTAEEVLALPPETVVVSRLYGGVIMPLKIVMGYVCSLGPEIGVSGEWLVRITKVSNYSVIVSLKNSKQHSVGFVAAALSAQWRKLSFNSQERHHAYEISLETQAGLDLYNELFQGKLTSLEKALLSKEAPIKRINENEEAERSPEPIIRELMHGVGENHTKLSATSIGFPGVATRVKNHGTLELADEQFTFMATQDNTPLGPVPAGTVLKSVRGGYYRFTMHQGMATRHKLQSKQFAVSLDEVSFPNGINSEEQLDPIPGQRLLLALHFGSRKNRWKEDEWQRALAKLSATLPVAPEQLKALRLPPQEEKTDFAEIAASLKLSEFSLRALAGNLHREGEGRYIERLQTQAQQHIEEWFADENNDIHALCHMQGGCQKRILKKTLSRIGEAAGFLHSAIAVAPAGSAALSEEDKHRFVRALLEFGRAFSENIFTVSAFFREMLSNRQLDPRNDFALCVRWQGSNIRRDQLTIFPSLLRRDSDKCFLQEETATEAAPEVSDRLKYLPPRLW